ncbi:MAG: hypothetical protein NZZ60_02150 [Bacteroidia bacterium]|nr:hypothetical protein [Bacteroidia bacterium]MCX7652646.1 hypothetical protein [Bacteroidia bacterium]MDW8417000.1 hypothetical protein [Bacteroidia bacterium]
MAKRSFILALFLVGCGDFLGRKTDLSFIDVPQYDNTLIAYVPVLPYWEGFQAPVDICVGYDELYYVADSIAGEIVCLDEAGRRIGTFRLPGVHAVAQDRRLDLLAAAPVDTIIGGQKYTLDAIHRIRLRGSGGYGLRYASVVSRSVHPFYFKSTFSITDTLVRFRRIAVLGNNSYYVTRNGPDQDPLKFGGPDDAVLLFDSRDQWQEAIILQSSTGPQPEFFRRVWGIATRARPPQSPFVSNVEGFWVSLTAQGLPLKVHSIVPREGEQGRFYEVDFRWAQGDNSVADGFLATPGKFERPEGIAFTGGSQPYLIVADAAKDSVYVFTLSGLEGVIPPPASGSRRPVKVSFGGRGTGPLQMNHPAAVAHHKKLLYVVDKGNRRIMRLRLTTDW